jgi:hypothetical protein
MLRNYKFDYCLKKIYRYDSKRVLSEQRAAEERPAAWPHPYPAVAIP